MWGVTVQNEPHVAGQFLFTYPCNGFDGTDEGSFLGAYLGPTLRAAHPELKIFVHDDQKEMLRGLGMEFEQYMKRQSLLQYMVNHPLGITIYGFLIDREFLRSFHMVVVSLTVFLVSMIMGGSHNQSHSST